MDEAVKHADPLRIVFLGSDAIALPMLESLQSDPQAIARVVGVFTQPDRPAGRGQHALPGPIKLWAQRAGLPVHQPERFEESARQALASLDPDLALVMAYGHILRDDVIATPRLGTLNLHTSVLPHYRGASPIQTAVASGETETGVTLMRIVRALDAGPLAEVEPVPIGPLETALEVEGRLAAASARVVARALPRLKAGALRFVDQDGAKATYCRRLVKEDGALDFGRPARELAARIRGLNPWPGCAFPWGEGVIKVGLADVLPGAAAGAPGTIVAAGAAGVEVATADGVVRFLRLQRAGGRMLPAGEFVRGCPLPVGSILPSRPMRPLVSDRPFPHRPPASGNSSVA